MTSLSHGAPARLERRAARWIDAGAWIADLPWPAAVIDAQGTILAVNRAWKETSARHSAAPESCGIGVDYLSVCDQGASDLCPESARFGTLLRRALLGQVHHIEMVCGGPLPSRSEATRLDRLPGAALIVSHPPHASAIGNLEALV